MDKVALLGQNGSSILGTGAADCPFASLTHSDYSTGNRILFLNALVIE